MYRYEMHLHTFPVSKCAKVGIRENLEFYKKLGFAGVFITNHFLDGNINIDKTLPYEEQIDFYFSDYETAKGMESEIGLRVFCGVEISYRRTDFLVYGLDKAFFLANPRIMELSLREKLAFLEEAGALLVHAHPFRVGKGIDHIRLYPECTHGVEVFNGCRTGSENEMAALYAEHYGFFPFGGTDNHIGAARPVLGGMESEEALLDGADLIRLVKEGKMHPFRLENPLL